MTEPLLRSSSHRPPPLDITKGHQQQLKRDGSNSQRWRSSAALPVDEFISLRYHQGLTKLSSDLHVLLGTVERDLATALEENSDGFYDYIFKLDGTDHGIQNALNQVDLIQASIEQLNVTIKKERSLLDEYLAEQLLIREKKNLLQLLIRTVALVSKLERLAGITPAKKSTESDPSWISGESLSDTKYAERVAVEFSQLQLLIQKGQDMPLISSLEKRVEAIGLQILSQVESNYMKCLDRVILTQSGKDDDLLVLAQCFRAYALLGHPAAAEAQFGARVISPAIEQIIKGATRNSDANTHSRSSRGSNSGAILDLSQIYDSFLSFLSDRCGPILQICYSRLKQLNFDLLANSVFPCFISALTALASRPQYPIFAPADPDIFFKNYDCTVRFLSQFEAMFPDIAGVVTFRETTEYRDFIKRWPINVYFRLRFKELVTSLGACYPQELSLDEISPKTISQFRSLTISSKEVMVDGRFHFMSSQATTYNILRCWSDQTFISVLSHRFWKLTLQLISRYHSWTNELIQLNSSENNAKEFPSADWRLWVLLWCDVVLFSQQLDQNFVLYIQPHFINIDSDSIGSAIESCISRLEAQADSIGDTVIQELEYSAMAQLQGVRSITSVYRHTNQPLPTKASPYLGSAFEQINQLQKEFSVPQEESINNSPKDSGINKTSNLTPIPSDILESWINKCLIKIINNFGTMVNELLVTLKRTEESLSHLKRSQMAHGTASSDEAKIRYQILLDVREFGTQVKLVTQKARVRAALFNLYDVVDDIAKVNKITLE